MADMPCVFLDQVEQNPSQAGGRIGGVGAYERPRLAVPALGQSRQTL